MFLTFIISLNLFVDKSLSKDLYVCFKGSGNVSQAQEKLQQLQLSNGDGDGESTKGSIAYRKVSTSLDNHVLCRLFEKYSWGI